MCVCLGCVPITHMARTNQPFASRLHVFCQLLLDRDINDRVTVALNVLRMFQVAAMKFIAILHRYVWPFARMHTHQCNTTRTRLGPKACHNRGFAEDTITHCLCEVRREGWCLWRDMISYGSYDDLTLDDEKRLTTMSSISGVAEIPLRADVQQVTQMAHGLIF